MDDEELKAQIEELRSRRAERIAAKENEAEISFAGEEEERKPKKDDGVWGALTFQAILAVAIAIAYVALNAFAPEIANDSLALLKDKTVNDFSFRDKVYDTVGGALTYLNQLQPIGENTSSDSGSSEEDTASESSSLPLEDSSSPNNSAVSSGGSDGMGGEFTPVDGRQLPSNATFAPIVFTGSITFPIKGGGRITSGFEFRDSPIYDKPEFHNGVDIAAPKGTNVLAAFDGIVVKYGEDKYLGKHIVLDHGKGFYTTYGHCDELIAKERVRVREGEVIAKVGSTGDSTGYHLHFGMQMDGLYFDPSYIFPQYIDASV